MVWRRLTERSAWAGRGSRLALTRAPAGLARPDVRQEAGGGRPGLEPEVVVLVVDVGPRGDSEDVRAAGRAADEDVPVDGDRGRAHRRAAENVADHLHVVERSVGAEQGAVGEAVVANERARQGCRAAQVDFTPVLRGLLAVARAAVVGIDGPTEDVVLDREIRVRRTCVLFDVVDRVVIERVPSERETVGVPDQQATGVRPRPFRGDSVDDVVVEGDVRRLAGRTVVDERLLLPDLPRRDVPELL